MSTKILVAQNIKELRYIIQNTKDNYSVLPLNLKTQLYCISRNLIFFDLNIYRKKLYYWAIHRFYFIFTRKSLLFLCIFENINE